MFIIYLSELRGSWKSWFAVSLSFALTGAIFVVIASVITSGAHALSHGDVNSVEHVKVSVMASMGLLLCVLVGMSIFSSVVSLVVESRRQALAGLQLVGATPSQIRKTLLLQIGLVSILSSLVGNALALLILPGYLSLFISKLVLPSFPAVADPLWILVANSGCILVAVLGGYSEVRRATRISPVEAFRSTNVHARKWTIVARVLWVIVSLGSVIACFATMPLITKTASPGDAMSSVIQISLLLIPILSVFIAQVAPFSIGWVTRAWTSVIPVKSSSWYLASTSVVGNATRLSKSVIPLMLSFGLLFSTMILGETIIGSLRSSGMDTSAVQGVDILSLLVLFGGPLAIALGGALSNLLMMSDKRISELSLDGVLGVSPRQQRTIPFLEGLVVVGTSLLLSGAMILVEIIFLRLSLKSLIPTFAVGVPWIPCLLFTMSLGLLVTACTTVPTVYGLRRGRSSMACSLTSE